jgi:hypothetical protein
MHSSDRWRLSSVGITDRRVLSPLQEVEPHDLLPGEKHVPSRWHETHCEGTPGVEKRGAHSSRGAALHFPRRRYHLRHRVPVHYSAQGEWTQPLHRKYVLPTLVS